MSEFRAGDHLTVFDEHGQVIEQSLTGPDRSDSQRESEGDSESGCSKGTASTPCQSKIGAESPTGDSVDRPQDTSGQQNTGDTE